MANNDYGGWLNWRQGESGPDTAELGKLSGFAGLFSPEVQAALGLPSMGSMTAEDYARAAAASGVDFTQTPDQGGSWIHAMKNGQATGEKAWAQQTPNMGAFELIPYLVGGLGIANAAGLLGGLGGSGAGAGGAAAGGSAAGGAAAGGAGAYEAAAMDALLGSGNAYMMAPEALAAMDAANVAALGGAGAGMGGTGAIKTFGDLPQIDKIAYDPIPTGGGINVPSFTSALPSLATGAINAGTAGSAASGLTGLLKDAAPYAPLIGGALGAAEAGKGNTSTSQQIMDPRMQDMLYGSGKNDPNSVFGAAMNLWQQNPSGINPTMQQGLDMGKAALTDPAYAQGYQQMRSIGQGLMSGGVAANPFANGQGGQVPQMGLLPGPDRIQSLMARGRGLLGQ